jgi:hypothetical protein
VYNYDIRIRRSYRFSSSPRAVVRSARRPTLQDCWYISPVSSSCCQRCWASCQNRNKTTKTREPDFIDASCSGWRYNYIAKTMASATSSSLPPHLGSCFQEPSLSCSPALTLFTIIRSSQKTSSIHLQSTSKQRGGRTTERHSVNSSFLIDASPVCIRR